jgi:anti-sigma regulatory factor (Ser/Thr protein kinase)
MSVAPDHSVSLTIENTIAELETVVAFVDRFGSDRHIPGTVIHDLNLCLDELLNNTISYGYGDGHRHEIVVTLRLADDWLTAEIQDDGKAFDPTVAAATVSKGALQSRKTGGLGIHFVKALVDQVEYRRAGALNRLTLKIGLKRGGADGNG